MTHNGRGGDGGSDGGGDGGGGDGGGDGGIDGGGRGGNNIALVQGNMQIQMPSSRWPAKAARAGIRRVSATGGKE